MGLINAFIDALDKKWGEQAMQKKLNGKDELLEGKDKIIEELQKENQNLRQAQKPEDGEDDEDGTGKVTVKCAFEGYSVTQVGLTSMCGR